MAEALEREVEQVHRPTDGWVAKSRRERSYWVVRRPRFVGRFRAPLEGPASPQVDGREKLEKRAKERPLARVFVKNI